MGILEVQTRLAKLQSIEGSQVFGDFPHHFDHGRLQSVWKFQGKKKIVVRASEAGVGTHTHTHTHTHGTIRLACLTIMIIIIDGYLPR